MQLDLAHRIVNKIFSRYYPNGNWDGAEYHEVFDIVNSEIHTERDEIYEDIKTVAEKHGFSCSYHIFYEMIKGTMVENMDVYILNEKKEFYVSICYVESFAAQLFDENGSQLTLYTLEKQLTNA